MFQLSFNLSFEFGPRAHPQCIYIEFCDLFDGKSMLLTHRGHLSMLHPLLTLPTPIPDPFSKMPASCACFFISYLDSSIDQHRGFWRYCHSKKEVTQAKGGQWHDLVSDAPITFGMCLETTE